MEEFRNRTQILLMTEAGAEGLNLQFCNLVVNYDLPWNPQRVEQRIGRCHRYGQQRDVLVLNFLNRQNAADARLYELLAQKLALFDGVFGSSDEILGALGSGIDFERRVLDIYQSCRSSEEIDQAFEKLRDRPRRADHRPAHGGALAPVRALRRRGPRAAAASPSRRRRRRWRAARRRRTRSSTRVFEDDAAAGGAGRRAARRRAAAAAAPSARSSCGRPPRRSAPRPQDAVAFLEVPTR